MSILSIIKFWELKTSPEQVRGSFNHEHYLKVLKAKANLK